MNNCYLSIGANQKNPERQLRLAIKKIKQLPNTCLIKASQLYWNKAWGVTTQQDFCNVMVQIQTTLPPHHLLAHCQTIEKKLGRIRKKPWGPRIIDIDIILYDDRTVKTANLTIPHHYYLARDFVLTPLLEIYPDFNVKITTDQII